MLFLKCLYQILFAFQSSDLLSHPHRRSKDGKGMPPVFQYKPTHSCPQLTFFGVRSIKVLGRNTVLHAPEPLHVLLTLSTCYPPPPHSSLPVSAPVVLPQSFPWLSVVGQSPPHVSSWHCVPLLPGVILDLFVHHLSLQWDWAWWKQDPCPWLSLVITTQRVIKANVMSSTMSIICKVKDEMQP